MTEVSEWTKDIYEKSVSSHCWWYTPYDEGWDGGDISTDDELREIVTMEQELGPVPEWAQQIVERSIHFACPCGHYLFPQPYLEAVSAIGSQTPPTLVHGCFTVERERKKHLMDYCLCLDAWLTGAPPDAPARELMALGYRTMDWHTVCTDLWETLGEHTELKDLLIERFLHLLRNWIKFAVWDDDLASEFGRDQYLGTLSETGDTRNPAKIHCYIEHPAPGFYEKASPRVQRLDARIAELHPEGLPWDEKWGPEWWLCAPKAFRFLERTLWTFGRGRPPEDGGEVPGFLQCEDTYPNHEEAAEWWRSFCTALEGWWRERPERGAVADEVNQRLGESTPVKRWLVRLFLRKLKRLEENDEQLTNLVRPQHGHKRGTKALSSLTEKRTNPRVI